MKSKVIIVHGEKQLADGSIHPEYVERLKRALELFGPETVIILTGGATRAGIQSESKQAREWLLEEIRNRDEMEFPEGLPTIYIEEMSRTTPENILFAKEVLNRAGIDPTEIIALVRSSAAPKTRFLYWRLGKIGASKVTVEECSDMKSLFWRIADLTILFGVAIIDPYDRWLLALPKKIFRNS